MRRDPSPSARRLLLAALCAGMGAGCAQATSAPPGDVAGPHTLNVGVPGDVTGIYPHIRNESFTEAVHSNAFEGLTRFDDDLRPVPAVAERWENPDDETWVFTLREGLLFSDGRPVRVDDVVASLRHATSAEATRHLLRPIAHVEAAGPREVRVRTVRPAPTLLNLLTFIYVLPADALDRPRGTLPHPAGTGPYAIESWTPGRDLTLRRNPHRAGAAAPFDRLTFTVITRDDERAAALRTGRIQLAEALSLGDLEALRTVPGVRVVSRAALRVLFLGLRTDRAPFADPRVREAFDLAIDRTALIARALDGHGTVASQIVPPSVSGYNRALAVTQPDPARARALLEEAGWARRPLRLYGPANRYVNGARILHEVARQLRAVDVEVDVTALEKERFFSLLGAPELELFLYGWSCGGSDASHALSPLLHTPRADGAGSENMHGFSDPELDRLIEAAEAEETPFRRRALLGQALARAAALRPLLPLLVQHESVALGPGVEWEPPIDMSLRLHTARPASPPRAASR